MGFYGISPKEFEQYIGNPGTLIIDLRDRDAYQERHVRGAVHIPFEEFWQKCVMLPKPQRTARERDGRRQCVLAEGICGQLADYELLLFYCERGNRSLMVAEMMRQRGWKAYSLTGGIHALTQGHFA